MQLFGSNSKKTSSDKEVKQDIVEGQISAYRVIIMSTRQSIIDDVRSILYLYNVLSIEVLSLEIEDIDENPKWSEFDIFVIDIKNNDNIEKISTQINRFIPIKASTILIGSNDSILFAEALSKKGIHFLLENSQLDRISNILYTRSESKEKTSKRIGSVVSFLGCKGGIGTSSLIVHILKNINQSTKFPILYIQGASTSQNADFIFESPVDKEGSITEINEFLQVKIEQDDEIGKYDFLDTASFNITIIDQNIGLHSSMKNFESIVTLSNIIIFIINRDPYSIKVAKNALEEINRISQKNNLILNKRFLFCLNDNQPIDKTASLQDSDIEEFLGRRIDFRRNYISSIDKFKKAYNSPEIDVISSAVIGIEKDSTQRHSFFSVLTKKKK